MTTFDDLVENFKSVVTVLEIDLLKNTGFYGAYRCGPDNLPYILIERNQPEIDKKMILVEEFKHMMTSYGVIIDQAKTDNIKQENTARALTYKELVPLSDLFECYQLGLTTEYDIAAELDVPQEFLHNAIMYFKGSTENPIDLGNGYMCTINDTISFYKISDNNIAK